MHLLQHTCHQKAYKPLILLCPFLALRSAVVILLAMSAQKKSKQWKLFISTAAAQISRETVFNILSPTLAEEIPLHFLCVAVMQEVGASFSYRKGSYCLSHCALTFKGSFTFDSSIWQKACWIIKIFTVNKTLSLSSDCATLIWIGKTHIFFHVKVVCMGL